MLWSAKNTCISSESWIPFHVTNITLNVQQERGLLRSKFVAQTWKPHEWNCHNLMKVTVFVNLIHILQNISSLGNNGIMTKKIMVQSNFWISFLYFGMKPLIVFNSWCLIYADTKTVLPLQPSFMKIIITWSISLQVHYCDSSLQKKEAVHDSVFNDVLNVDILSMTTSVRRKDFLLRFFHSKLLFVSWHTTNSDTDTISL